MTGTGATSAKLRPNGATVAWAERSITIESPMSHAATMPSNHQWFPVATTARIVMNGWAMISHRNRLVLNTTTPSATSSDHATCTEGIAES